VTITNKNRLSMKNILHFRTADGGEEHNHFHNIYSRF
jgi:hypothetical protein